MSDKWLQAWPSLKVYPLDLKPEQVGGIDTIAHALCQKVRFNGHSKYPMYTVGQHCVDGSRWIGPRFALAFLLHEVSEVFLPDIPRPLKPSVFVKCDDESTMSWGELERQHRRVIFHALGLGKICHLVESKEIKTTDLRMLASEQRDLMCPAPDDWNLPFEPFSGKITVREPEALESEFVNRYNELILEIE